MVRPMILSLKRKKEGEKGKKKENKGKKRESKQASNH